MPPAQNYSRAGSVVLILQPFDDCGDSLAAADTQRSQTDFLILLDQRMQQRHQNSRSAGADRMPQRYRAAIYIYFLLRPAQFLADCQELSREGFICFD